MRDKAKSVLINKKASKKGRIWNDIASGRIVKQHGGYEIPEGDLHAIPKYDNPVQAKRASREEIHEALTDLEKEISELKSKERKSSENE